ncbi:hypothetical protein ES703_112152 [subsurface metagenome]
MAIVEPSPLITSIRGKLGGNVFSVWKGLQIVKEYAAPGDPGSDKQILVRNLMAAAQAAWTGLSAAEKMSWEAVANTQLRRPNKRYPRGGVRNLVPENFSRAFGRDVFIGNFMNAYRHTPYLPATWDLLDNDWNALGAWAEGGVGTSDINPAGQLRLLPDQNQWINRFLDIGVLPNDGYTVYCRVFMDDLGTIASGNTKDYQFFDNVRIMNIHIGTDAIGVQKGDISWEDTAIVFVADTWYEFMFSLDSAAQVAIIYRRTDVTQWEKVATYTDVRALGGDDGLVRTYQRRGGVGASQAHCDFIKIASELLNPVVTLHAPVGESPPVVNYAYDLSYAAGVLDIELLFLGGGDPNKHRFGAWVYGGLTAHGKIYRQWVGYQPNPYNFHLLIEDVYVAINGIKALVDLEDTWLYVQIYICDITTGLITHGSDTKEIAIE